MEEFARVTIDRFVHIQRSADKWNAVADKFDDIADKAAKFDKLVAEIEHSFNKSPAFSSYTIDVKTEVIDEILGTTYVERGHMADAERLAKKKEESNE